MTNTEFHTELDRRLDKTGTAYFTDAEKDAFLNDALYEFVLTRYKEFERNEKARQDIAPLVRRVVVKTGSTSSGDRKFFKLEGVPRFMYILNMAGIFKDTCNGANIVLDYDRSLTNASDPTPISDPDPATKYDLFEQQEELIEAGSSGTVTYSQSVMNSIKPIQHDDWYSLSNDPFNKPSDGYPVYRVAGDIGSRRYVEIQSDSNPLAVVMDYLKQPVLIDKVNDASDTIELPVQTHRLILDIAEKNMLSNVENQFRTQVETFNYRENIK